MLLLAGVLGTLLPLHYHLKKKELIAGIDKQLQQELVLVLPTVAPPRNEPLRMEPNEQGSMNGPFTARDDMRQTAVRTPIIKEGKTYLDGLAAQGRYVVIIDPRGVERNRYGAVPAGRSFSDYVRHPEEQGLISRNDFRELVKRQPGGLAIVMGYPLAPLNKTMADTRLQLILVGLSIMLIGFFGGLLIIGKAIHPIREISRTAEQIASGERSSRIQLADAPDELAGMAHTLNETFDHLDEAIETQKRFSADASHELRTPIAVVIAQTQAALKRDRTTEEYKTVLEACLRAGQRMKTMANSLLTLTRIDSRENALSKIRCDLNTVLSGAVDSASLLSAKHPVDFKGTDKPLMAEIDRERIHQIVTNLLANAVQHNPQGCPLCVFLREDGDTAAIDIADQGTGIPEEHLPHIFERFYRVDKSRSREQGGAGLGLSIVQSLVEAHGGQISVQSEPGHGTTFTITLPLS